MMALLRLPALILLMLSQLIVLPTIKGDDDGAALLDFIHRADPANAFKLQWVNGKNSTDYCNWPGVIKCDKNKRVVQLFLENIGLNGTIVPDFFSRLDKLKNLSLRRNKLGGTIPDLSGAQKLEILLLDSNYLTGLIPNSLGQLPSLKIISLSNNDLSGSLPDSPYFNTLSFFDVSYNDLSGPIPQSLSHNNASSFEGNVGLCGEPLSVKCPKKKVSVIHIVLGIVGGMVLILVGLRWFRRSKGQDQLVKPSPYSDDKSGGKLANSLSMDKARKSWEGMKKKEMSPMVHPDENFFTEEAQGEGVDEKGELVLTEEGERRFKLEDLLKASAMIVGRGILGTSYKATLEGGLEVVVKRLRAVNHCGRSAFLENMATIERARHPNILPLTAHFYGKEEKLLIYNYIPHGSLFNALHSNEGRRNTPLDWRCRVNIARGVASALDYIHTSLSSSPCKAGGEGVLHGNLKSTNVLLGPNMEALVADFGMASMLANKTAQSYMAGHRAPECCRNASKKLTQSVDTYSYGVLLLELLTGKVPLQATITGGQGVDLPAWVESVVKQEWTAEVFDRELSLTKTEEDELVALLRIAMACVSPKLEQRPTMAHVLQCISEDMKSLEDHDMQALEASLNVGEGHGFDDDDDDRSSLQLDADHSAMDMPNYSDSFSFQDQVSRISNNTF